MCALSSNKVFAWGKGIDGQLGTGTQSNAFMPKPVTGFLGDVDDVGCGGSHTIVRMADGKCYGFGNGIYGQLGIGSNKNSSVPVLIPVNNIS